jgi:transcriptional regulator with XRE-family HTH domain
MGKTFSQKGGLPMSFKQRRVKTGLTQEQVAEKLGVDRTTVSKWDVMSAMPRAELLPKIASLYGCSIDDLFVAATEPYEESIPGSGSERNG